MKQWIICEMWSDEPPDPEPEPPILIGPDDSEVL